MVYTLKDFFSFFFPLRTAQTIGWFLIVCCHCSTVGKFIVWRSLLRIAKPTHKHQCKTTAVDLNECERLVSEHKKKRKHHIQQTETKKNEKRKSYRRMEGYARQQSTSYCPFFVCSLSLFFCMAKRFIRGAKGDVSVCGWQVRSA